MSLKELNLQLSDVSDISELVPLAIALLYKAKKPPHDLWVWFFALSAPIKICTLITAKFQLNNMPLFHLLAALELTALFIFYNRLLFGKIQWGGLTILLSFNAINSLFLEGFWEFNGLSWSVNTIFSICLGLYAYYRIYDRVEFIILDRNPTFVINTGWMLYFSGALFTYILGSRILAVDARDIFHNSWIIESISNTIKNVIVAYGLWLASKV